MLYNKTMRPAYAGAGSNSFSTADGSKINQHVAFAEGHSASDDFGSFGGSQKPPRTQQRTTPPPRQPKRAPQRNSSGISLKPILIAVAAVIAIVLLIMMIVAIFSAPKKEIKLDDNAYFVYTDDSGKNYVVANGKVLKHTFEGEVKLVTAKDSSFAYVFEQITSSDTEDAGTKIYILKGNSLKDTKAKADEILVLAEYEPGIIYKKNSRAYYYSSSDHSPITTNASAANFDISGDGSTVIYTVDSTREVGYTELMYFCNGGAEKIGPLGFLPVGISNNGRYVYGINESSGILYYLDVRKGGEKVDRATITQASDGIFSEITGMNVDGNEIIFCTETAEKGIVSYFYKVGSSAPTLISEGYFTPINADRDVVCPDTFVNSYFKCNKNVTALDGGSQNVTMTYFFDKSEGARPMASTTGQFSPDNKYFYYINEDNNLVRVPLNSRDFAKDTEKVMADVTDFAVVEKGDVYIMIPDGKYGMIFFWDASTAKRTVITYDANLNSMELSVNSVYFSETVADETVVYVSTSGSSKEKASFKSASLTETPKMQMGAGEKGYAYFTDANGTTKLYYTANGEKFSLVASGCTISGVTSGVSTEKPTDKPSTDEEEEE